MDKAEKVINYIIYCFRAKPKKLSKVKLAKILWLCEKEFLYNAYKSLSDLDFIKMDYGPVPKKYNEILQQMQNKGIIKINNDVKYDKKITYFYSLQKPIINDFQALEIKVIDDVINEFRNKTAKKLSIMSHDNLWQNTKKGDIMPTESVFLRDVEIADENDIKWAKNELESKGLL